MKKFLQFSALLTTIWLLTISSAEACCCGIMRHRSCCYATCCATPCYEYQTVMKTCTRVVYETQQYTAYRTVCQPVCERKIVEAVRYVPETHYRTCTQTYCRPVYETKTNTVSYTVCRPVYETQTKQIRTTVCKPTYETAEREECYTVCKPVTYKRKVQVCSGHWETREVPPSPCARPRALPPHVLRRRHARRPNAGFGCRKCWKKKCNARSMSPKR